MGQWIVTRKMAALGVRPEFWLACLLAWLLTSAGRSLGTPWAAAALTEALRWGVGIALALTLSGTLHQAGKAARVLTSLAGLLALTGIWDGFRPDRGVVGPYQDHQLYSSALLALLPLAAALALTERDTLWRIGAQAVAGAALVCLMLSQTRSAWVGLLVAAAVFGWLWLKQSRGTRRPQAILAAKAAALLVAAMSVWTVTAQSDLRAPLASRTATLSTLSSDQSWQARLITWRGAARMVAAFPLTGCGLGRYPGVQAAWTHQGSLLKPSLRPSLSEEAHDLYLQTAAETGLIGLALYGAALSAFAVQCRSRLNRRTCIRPSSRDALVIAVLSMVAGQSVDALASPSWQFAEVSLFFWAALGVGLAALQRADSETVTTPLPFPLRRAGQMALSGAVAVLLASQALPVGLLTPVEAYTSPSPEGYVFNASNPGEFSYTPTSLPSSGGTIAFTLYAHYTDPNNNNAPHNEDVTFDGAAPGTFNSTQFIVSGNHTLHATSFSTSPTTRNILTVDAQDVGTTLTILGKFYINGASKTISTSFVPHSGS